MTAKIQNMIAANNTNINHQQLPIFEDIRPNGLQIRNQRNKLDIVA